jgi:predicted permease
MIWKLVFSLSLIIVGTGLGYLLKIRGVVKEKHAGEIAKWVLITILSFILLLSFWNIKFTDLKVLSLPVVGTIISFMGIAWGFIMWKAQKFNIDQAGSYIFSSALSNILYFGTFLCLVLFGERGYDLSLIYAVYYNLFFFIICLPLAKVLSARRGRNIEGELSVVGFIFDVKNIPILAIILGIVISFLNIPIPRVMLDIRNVLVPINTFLLVLSTGVGLRIHPVRRHLKEVSTMFAYKFLIVPTVTILLSLAFGLLGSRDYLTFKVLMVQGLMPTAVNATVLINLFDFDKDVGSSLFLYTHAFLIIQVPLLILIFYMLGI